MNQGLFHQGLTKVVVTSLATLTTTTIIHQPTYAQGTSFYCGTSKYRNQSVPTTFARTQDGRNVAMIRWLHTNYFSSNWTPQVRCQEVARRFQKNYDNGMLRRINTGTLKGQPVVCAAIKQSDPCTDSTLLFTLNRNVNPEKALKMLMDRRGLASGNAFVSRGKKNNSPFSVEFDSYIQGATVEPSNPNLENHSTP
ncbi:hypothetical protein CEN50_17280 [Fischerella thermalis CCMEE 5268]|uniref:Uncharacterized protein n=1 Tax=Fischerella thermalis CCMEE 5268 TaxID=2019662 RepID=A0A2N6KDE5_9CYAN|nr:COP23 domain-containing protein [Fischerella thermalis]PLZ96844.1 hypothetical protein CEN50_17280 [Fischerella thermalis CCMEE 5268]